MNQNLSLWIVDWKASRYRDFYKLNETNITGFLVSPPEPIKWKTILFYLLPIANSIKKSNITDRHNIKFIFQEPITKSSYDLLKHFAPIYSIQFPENATYYKYFNIPSIRTKVSLSDHFLIQKALNSNFSFLRSKFVTKNMIPKQIALSHDLWKYKDIIQSECPTCNIVQFFSGNDLTSIADLISQCQIFIGNHFSQLLNVIWLQPNQTAVINAEEPELRCNEWLESLANNHSIKYYSVYPRPSDNFCFCRDFSCYPSKASDFHLDPSLLTKAINQAVKELEIIN